MSQQIPPALPVATLDYYVANPGLGAQSYAAEGKLLKAANGTVLPCRCVKCNTAEAVTMVQKQFTWYPRWTLLLCLISLLIGAIVAMCMQKKGKVTYGICQKHRRKRRNAILITWGGVLLALLLAAAAITVESGPLGLLAFLMFMASLIFAAIAVPVLQPDLIRKDILWLKGASADFLSNLHT